MSYTELLDNAGNCAELESVVAGIAEIIVRCIRASVCRVEIIFSMFLYSKYLQNIER